MTISPHTFDVVHENVTYVFRYPSFLEEMMLGVAERDIRRDLERKLGISNATGEIDGLDQVTYLLVKASALFKVLLEKCSDMWPYKKGPNGEFAGVDYNEWDSDKGGVAIAVYLKYVEEANRFRERRNPAKPVGQQGVEGGANPEAKPV